MALWWSKLWVSTDWQGEITRKQSNLCLRKFLKSSLFFIVRELLSLQSDHSKTKPAAGM